MELLEEQLEMADSANSSSSDDDEDEDEKPRSRKASKESPKAEEPEDDDEDDEDIDEDEDDSDVDEDDDDEESYYWTREQLDGKSLAELKKIAKELEWTAADMKGLDVDGLIDLITGEGDEDDDEGEDESDDDADITEDDLRNMSLSEVKKVAREMGVRFKPGTSKDDIVDLILDAAAEDDDDEEVPF